MRYLPPPEAFGLPDKYEDWRPRQDEAVARAMDSPHRFVMQVCPTGFGKSLAYITAAILHGGRAVVLTSTKGLQTQLLDDFAGIGAVDIRGRNAYECRLEHDGTTCDHGPCIAGVACGLRDSGCEYYDQQKLAQRAPIVITNYAYWMNVNEYGEGVGGFDLIVCDEAHSAPDMVGGFLTVTLRRDGDMVEEILPGGNLEHLSIGEWVAWAKVHLPKVKDEVGITKKQVAGGGSRELRRRLARLIVLQSSLESVRDMDDNWVVESTPRTLSFSPIWPGPWCESLLFRQIRHVMLVSASVCKKTAEMLGVEELDIMEFPHSFPLENRLLVHVPTVRMNYRLDKIGMRLWLTRIDQILKPRQDRKGIIHTVSYKRRDAVLANSKFRNMMMSHKRADTEVMVRRFKQSRTPRFLVSPVMTTGWDFAYNSAEFQIIGKLPYPDTSSRLVKARTKEDPEYSSYVAMQDLVQACGRIIRYPDDRGESLIIDDNVLWFMRDYAKFAPEWFVGAFVRRNTIPPAPEKLEVGNG